jgi:hypothetical protein
MSEADQMAKEADESQPQQTVQFHYIKGKDFRVVSADGAMGSITPQGRLLVTVYSERVAIPRTVVYELKPDGDLGEIVETEGRSGFVREMEVAILMDRDGAETLRDWLTSKLKSLDEFEKEEDGE